MPLVGWKPTPDILLPAPDVLPSPQLPAQGDTNTNIRNKASKAQQGISENITRAATEEAKEKAEKKKGPNKESWWEKFKELLRKLKGDQGYRDDKGNIYKVDKFHKNHIDVSDRRGRKIKEFDINTGEQIWPGGLRNRNK